MLSILGFLTLMFIVACGAAAFGHFSYNEKIQFLGYEVSITLAKQKVLDLKIYKLTQI